MSQQYVSPFSDRVAAICNANKNNCDRCPMGGCAWKPNESHTDYVKRINAMAEEVVSDHKAQA